MLVEARNHAGMTQGDLARATGMPQPTISDIEAGKRRVDLVELFDLVRAMNLGPLEFLAQYAERTESQ